MGSAHSSLKAVKLPRKEELRHSPNSKASAYVARTSFEIARDSLRRPFQRLEGGKAIWLQELAPLPVSYFLRNWRWYITGHWKQALATLVAYALTFSILKRLA